MGWEDLVIQVIYLLMASVIPIVGLALRKYVMSKAVLNDLLMKRELVDAGVEFVEKFYTAVGGERKYKYALDWISAQFTARGLSVSHEEIRGLIEAAVYNLESGWASYDYDEDYGNIVQ